MRIPVKSTSQDHLDKPRRSSTNSLRDLEGIGSMTRFLMLTGYIVFVSMMGGCCYPGSPYCHLNYPNLIGYTYPNWCPPPLKTPPNGPPDEVLVEMQNAENVPQDAEPSAEEIPAGTPSSLPSSNQEASVLSISRSSPPAVSNL